MTGWYLYSITCELLGFCLFLYGFFLVNYDDGRISSSRSSFVPTNDARMNTHLSKTILIVIDALRYDFVADNNTRFHMPYLHSLTENKEACVFPCRVHLPTVTMPRIKAMTIGSISNFLDIALNFGSSRVKYDNIILQMKRKGKKVVFYGDDTWIKLFPNLFYRQEGVTSFFVTDFYEVDNIVTKNVNYELTRDDWDVMILHYLGLDHIGHVEGPGSDKISIKLQEMDSVIKKLHNYLAQWKQNVNENYLLIVCADHGMRDSGGHGGSSFHEILVPLVTIGMHNCSTNNETSQVDLAVTLSFLLGLPIPRESIGKVIPEFLNQVPISERVEIHRRVTKHLMKKYIEIVGPLNPDIEEMFKNAHTTSEKVEEACQTFQFLSNYLSSSLVTFLTKFDIFYLFVGVIIVFQAFCLPLTSNKTAYRTFLNSVPLTGVVLAIFLIISYFYHCQSAICNLSKDNILINLILISVIVFNTMHIFQTRKLICRLITAVSITENDRFLSFIVMGLFLQILCTFSTSLIEEEHMFWYFLWATWLVLLLCQYHTKRSANILIRLLISHRILKKFNQTGDQYASLPDIGDWFRMPERKLYLTIFLLFELLHVVWAMQYKNPVSKSEEPKRTKTDVLLSIDKYLDILCAIIVFLYRAAVGEVIFFGKMFLSNGGTLEFQLFKYLMASSVGLKLMKCLRRQRKGLGWSFIDVCIDAWILITILLMRPHNVILPSALVVTSKWLSEIIQDADNREIKIVISHHWLAYVYFFYQGNSNSLATIDIMPGYIGQSEYNAIVAGTLIVISTYAMPVLAYMLMLKEIKTFRRNTAEPAIRLLLMFVNLYVAIYLIVVIMQRHHLFIWSVFSPKLFYLAVYSLILYPVIVISLYISEKK